METLSPDPKPTVVSDDLDRWNQASLRLTHYLRAYRLASHLHQTKLVTRILTEARQEHLQRPEAEPVTLTMELAKRRIGDWFARMLEGSDIPAERRLEAGLLAYRLSHASERWPGKFLEEDVPAEMGEAMRASTVRTGPDLMVSSMTSRGVDFGQIETIARQTWQQWDFAQIGRAVFFWGGIYAIGYYFIRSLA